MATTKTGGTGGSGNKGKSTAAAGVPAGGTQSGGASGSGRAANRDATAKSAATTKTGATSSAGAAKQAAKAPAKAPARAPAKGPAKRASSAEGSRPGMRDQLREFCASRLGGWSHDEWERLLGDLRESGHDVSDQTAVGMDLERERLNMVLEKVPGVGAPKARALVAHFGRLYDLRQASPDEIAQAAKVPRPLAERIAEAIR